MHEPPDPSDAEPARYPHRERDAELVRRALDGDQAAFGVLYDAWFDRVFDLTRRIVRNHDIALEVSQDAFLSAWRNLSRLQDPGAFGGWLLRIARNGALNRQRREQRASAVDDQELAVMEAVGASNAGAPAGFALEDQLAAATDPVRAAERAEVSALVWEAADALGERDAEVLDLQLRHGLTPAEVGEVLGINRNAANQLLHRVRGRFEKAVKARMLWRGNRPACSVLDDLLRSAGIDAFGAEAVKVADRHADGCATCSERRELQLEPSALFAAVPFVAVPIVFKQQTAYALEQAGVPMGGSAFSSSSVGSAVSAGPGAGGSGAGGGGGSAAATSASGGSGIADGSGGRTAGRRVGRGMLAAAAVAALVLLAVGALLVGSGDESPVVEVAGTAVRGSVRPKSPGSTAVTQPGDTTPAGTEPTDSTDPSTGPEASTPPTTAGPGEPSPSVTFSPGGGGGGGSGGGGGDPTSTAPSPTAPPSSVPGPTVTAPVVPPEPVVAAYSVAPVSFTAADLRRGTVPVVTWNVTGASAVSVDWSGPAGSGGVSSAPSGSAKVCPGTQLNGACISKVGTYTFTLTASVQGRPGSVVRTATVTVG